jgi:hypothetical protein
MEPELQNLIKWLQDDKIEYSRKKWIVESYKLYENAPLEKRQEILNFAKFHIGGSTIINPYNCVKSIFLNEDNKIPIDLRDKMIDSGRMFQNIVTELSNFNVQLYATLKLHSGLIEDTEISAAGRNGCVILYYAKTGQFVRYSDVKHRLNDQASRQELESTSNYSEIEIEEILSNSIYKHLAEANAAKSDIYQAIPNDCSQKIIIFYISEANSDDNTNKHKLHILREYIANYISRELKIKILESDIFINNYMDKNYMLIVNAFVESKVHKDKIIDGLKDYINQRKDLHQITPHIKDLGEPRDNYCLYRTKLLGNPAQNDDLDAKLKTLDKILATSTDGNGKSISLVVNVNINNNTIINNNVNSNNTTNSNNTVNSNNAIKIKSDKVKADVIKFIDVIKTKRPKWYKENTEVRVSFIRDRFNDTMGIKLSKNERIYTGVIKKMLGDGLKHPMNENGNLYPGILLKRYKEFT